MFILKNIIKYIHYNERVKPEIVEKLNSINKKFYQTFALQFSSTRKHIQPGILKILNELKPDENILDLGCGNGELAAKLLNNRFHGQYLGLDFSDRLLELSLEKLSCMKNYELAKMSFLQVDLMEREWYKMLLQQNINIVFAFAMLHHIPSHASRLNIIQNIHTILTSGCEQFPGKKFIHSTWQFHHSQKLKARILPWETLGLAANDVEVGDHLLDWRQGGFGIRYVHLFSEQELVNLAMEGGFNILDSFYSDGKEGNLALYQIWEPIFIF